MAKDIRTVGVIGAGVMGSGIAAHMAGAGLSVHLLDIVPPNLEPAQSVDPRQRNRFALAGLERALAAKPALFFDPDAASLITPGNLEDHLDRLEGCDLVIEAVVENLETKQRLFERIAPRIAAHAILASNTSGLSIAEMSAVLPEGLARRFVVMHFFNPVRYMRLLEIAPGPATEPNVLETAAQLGEWLGKGVVYAKDTPNFIGNRIGVYALMLTVQRMLADGLSIEAVDKIVGPPLGRPKSAAFGTADLVGIDTFVHVAEHCHRALPHDEERDVFSVPHFIRKMVQDGRLGRKSGAGFYKKVGSEILVLDLGTNEYRTQEKVRFDSLGVARNEDDVKRRIKALINADDAAGRFAWSLVSRTLCYSARRVGEIADDIVNIDRAMRWGYNWELGPFETWDAIGVGDSVSRMQREGLNVPAWVTEMLAAGRSNFYQGSPKVPDFWAPKTRKAALISTDPRELRLAAFKPEAVVGQNLSASLIDIGDGVACFEVHTKMNTVDADVIALLYTAADDVHKNFDALVIGNDGEHFGAGANLFMILAYAQQKQWQAIQDVVGSLQRALQRLRYASFPVVSAPCQYTLGGAAELAMAADAAQAYAETYMGLVEVGVGLIPAGTGCLRMVERFSRDASRVTGADLLPFIAEASLNIATGKVATSADEAKKLRYLLSSDGISFNRSHQLYHAKQRALGMARSGYRPRLAKKLAAAGHDAARTIGMRIWTMLEGGYATQHDALVANKLAHVLCGGNVAPGALVDEQHYLDLEIEAFMSLCSEPKSQERMQHMLMHGKPLRN